MALQVYETMVKPLCGDSLPAVCRALAEQPAEREPRTAQLLARQGIGRRRDGAAGGGCA